MRIRFTESAREQLLHAIDYIRVESPLAARRFRERIELALRQLETFPESGRHIPEFPELPYRELIFKPYRFFYRVGKEFVWIVAVWHGAQRPEEPEE